MAVKLRLKRMGSKKKPFYRIVAIDSRNKNNGYYIELLGTYDPLKQLSVVNNKVALEWLFKGAIPSKTVRNIFSKNGIMKEFDAQRTLLKLESLKKSPTKKPSSKKVVAKKTTVKNVDTKKKTAPKKVIIKKSPTKA